MTIGEKVCVDCLIIHPVGNFPVRDGGKARARCISCFRKYANLKRRKEKENRDVADLPVFITVVAQGQESWVDVVTQILVDQKFLSIPEAVFGGELIDLKALLKATDPIANLVEEERENEKNSYLSPGFDRRTGQSRRGVD